MKTKYITMTVFITLGSIWAYQHFDVDHMSTIGGILFALAWLFVVGLIIRLSGADDEKWE